MKIKVWVEIKANEMATVAALAQKCYREVTKKEKEWWKKTEKQCGAKVMLTIAKGEWEA